MCILLELSLHEQICERKMGYIGKKVKGVRNERRGVGFSSGAFSPPVWCMIQCWNPNHHRIGGTLAFKLVAKSVLLALSYTSNQWQTPFSPLVWTTSACVPLSFERTMNIIIISSIAIRVKNYVGKTFSVMWINNKNILHLLCFRELDS